MADTPGDAIDAINCHLRTGKLIEGHGPNTNVAGQKCVVGHPAVLYLTRGVFAFDLCPPGMMCKLDCPWLSPYLFVSLSKWLITSREQPVMADIWGYCWEPGGTHSARCPRAVSCFPQEYGQLFSAGICTGYVSGFRAGIYP